MEFHFLRFIITTLKKIHTFIRKKLKNETFFFRNPLNQVQLFVFHSNFIRLRVFFTRLYKGRLYKGCPAP